MAVALVSVPAYANPPAKPKGPPQYEISGGAEIAGPSWSAYSTTVIALSALSKSAAGGIQEDSWRLRAGAGYWRYSDTLADERSVREAFKRSSSFADLLLGYHQSFGELTVKAYAGIIYSNGRSLKDGLDDHSPGADFAAKVLIESWFNLTPDAFAQLDAGWLSLRDTRIARARLGYRISPSFSVGPEIGYLARPVFDPKKDAEPHTAAWRYGGFVRFEWKGGEVSLSAGLADDDRDSHLYATINALMRF